METTYRVQPKRISQPSFKERTNYVFKLGYIIIAVAAIGSYFSWTSTSVYYLRKVHVVENNQQESWVACLLPIGAFLGSLPVGVLADKYGRKFVAWFSVIPMASSWFIICFLETRAAVCGARFFAGVGCGAASIVIPMYFYELTNSYVKRHIVHLVYWFFNLGIVWPYNIKMAMNRYVDPTAKPFEGPVILLTGFLSFFSVAIISLPESPMWLEDRGKREEAEKAIKKLTGTYVKLDRREPIRVTGNSGLRLSALETISDQGNIFLILGLMTLQQFSGIGPLIFYLKESIDLIVNSNVDFLIYYFIVSVPMLMAALCNVKLHQCLEEKCTLILSTFLMAISGSFLAGIAYFHQSEHGPFPFVFPMLLMMVYLIGFNTGLGPIPWIMIGKMFPSNSRKVMYNLAVTYSWALLFVTTKVHMDLAKSIGMFGTLLIYVFINLFGMFFATCFIPRRVKETQEEVLENLDEVNENIRA